MAKGRQRKRTRKEIRRQAHRKQQAKRRTTIVAAKSDWKSESPCWSFRILQLQGPYGWERASANDLKAVAERLGHFEAMKWGELVTLPGNPNHLVSVDDLGREARQEFERIFHPQDQVDELMSLRLDARKRVWGRLDHDTPALQLLWWDPEHQVCPSIKK